MRIDLPSLEVMRAVGSCKQLWNRLSNDEYFEFRAYLRYATGADISVYGSESPAEWVRARRLIDALERSVGFANLLLPHEPTASDMLRLTDWLERTVEPARFDVEIKVLQRLLSHLGQRLVGMSNRTDDRIDNLIRARQITVHDERFSREEFDAFISYKQRDYADVASRLYQALTERGFHCWLDVEELRLARTTRVDDLALKHQLRRALSVCRHTVFFEMAQEATMDENVRGEHETFLWQSFEQRYARGLVYVSPSTNRVDTGMGEKLGEWAASRNSRTSWLTGSNR